jgi:hypothetical protein
MEHFRIPYSKQHPQHFSANPINVHTTLRLLHKHNCKLQHPLYASLVSATFQSEVFFKPIEKRWAYLQKRA